MIQLLVIKLPLPAFDARFVTSISKLADACKVHKITFNAILITHGAECSLTKRQHIQQMSVAEMSMLQWMCGHTRKDRIGKR
jgi:hypothetical protein